MEIKEVENIHQYLEPTEFCDCDNELIITKAKDLTKNNKNPKEKALSIFNFVRDEIKFMLDYIPKASETLEKGYGFCVPKCNLQVALLRSIKLPARYHIVSLKKECLKGIIHNSVYNQFPKIITFHPWCECFLNDKWIICDTLFDKDLVTAVYNKGIFGKKELPEIDWDGESDLNLMQYWMVEDHGPQASIDDLIKTLIKKGFNPEKSPIEVMNLSNKYTERLRKKGS